MNARLAQLVQVVFALHVPEETVEIVAVAQFPPALHSQVNQITFRFALAKYAMRQPFTFLPNLVVV